MSLGLALTLVVMAAILLGAALYSFAAPETIKLRKNNKQSKNTQNAQER